MAKTMHFFRTAIQTITVRPITASKTTTIIRCALIENVIAKNSTEETSVDHCPYVSGIGTPVPAIVAALVFIGFASTESVIARPTTSGTTSWKSV